MPPKTPPKATTKTTVLTETKPSPTGPAAAAEKKETPTDAQPADDVPPGPADAGDGAEPGPDAGDVPSASTDEGARPPATESAAASTPPVADDEPRRRSFIEVDDLTHDQLVADFGADLARMPEKYRNALIQAVTEYTAPAPKAPAATPGATPAPASPPAAEPVKRVRINESFEARYNGQKFHLNKGGTVANEQFAAYLAERAYPVTVLKEGDA